MDTVGEMRRWSCDSCRHHVRFDSGECPRCGALLGYVPADLAVRSLVAADSTSYAIGEHDERWWRCLNAAYGCNWMVPADIGDVWCRSCRLTRGRPDNSRPDAVTAWSSAEASKRRVIHQLDDIGLAVEPLSPDHSDGLAFDLVHLDDGSATTGYNLGVVTLDLAEADDRHRERLRWQLGEAFRTVIGHLRHEAGHHYFHCLVTRPNDLHRFRTLFGDETADYSAALAHHYAAPAGWRPDRHITSYATAHPIEDWAETFAHYLHIRDAAETAHAHRLLDRGHATRVTDDFARLIEYWNLTIDAINDITETLGVASIYPLTVTGDLSPSWASSTTRLNRPGLCVRSSQSLGGLQDATEEGVHRRVQGPGGEVRVRGDRAGRDKVACV